MLNSGEIPTVHGWFLGESGNPLRTNLMTPLLSPITLAEKRYNRAFLKTRKTIECMFDIWKSRWRSIDKHGGSLCYSPERVCKLIVSPYFCLDHGLQIEYEDLEPEIPSDLVETDSDNGVNVRQELIANYFN